MAKAKHLAKRLTLQPRITQEKGAYLLTMSRFMIDFVVVGTDANMVQGIRRALYAIGVHVSALWDVLTFVLSFIPFIDLIIGVIPARVCAGLHPACGRHL